MEHIRSSEMRYYHRMLIIRLWHTTRRNHRSYENNTYCTYPSRGCGVFAAVSGTFQTPDGKYSGTVTEDSSIKEYLNNTYYPTLNGTAKTQVQSHAFNIGSVQFLDVSGNDSIQKNIAGEKITSGQEM